MNGNTQKEKTMKKYLRKDGTLTGWIESPESDTDREVFTLSPLTRKYQPGEVLDHRRFGRMECVSCERLVNEDQCGDWGGPSFLGYFVRG